MEIGPTMPLKHVLADRIIRRYLQGYSARMQVIRPRWSAKTASSDPAMRQEGLVLLYESHDACHEGAFNSMRLKPTEWSEELSANSLALTLDQARVTLSDVEFAVLQRDTEVIEDLSKRFLAAVAAGFTDASDQQSTWREGLTVPQRAFQWNHGQWFNVASVIRKISEISPRAERLAEHEGLPDILARLGTVSGRMDAAYEQLTMWLDVHIDDQP